LIMCLNYLYEYLPPTSAYFKSLFWVAMSIVQISDVKLFNAAVSLLETILKIQDFSGGFGGGIEECYMIVREGPIDQILAKLGQVSGLNFGNSFSFGVAGHLLKGLKHPKAKENTSRLLSSFLDISIKTQIGTNILGYLAALLPVEGQIPILRELALDSGAPKNVHQYFYTEQLVPDVKHAALLFTFLVTILQNTDKEHEQIFIYDALKEGVIFMPQAFCVIEDILFPMMSEVLQRSQIPKLIESVHSIMESFYQYKQKNHSPPLTRLYLNEIGFHKLPECATFEIENEIRREITKLVILLVDNLVKEVIDINVR